MRRVIISILILIVIFVGMICILSWIETYREKSRVEKIARNIEFFKQQNARLPNTEDQEEMQALGFEMDTIGWNPDFIPLNNTDYELWLYYGFDGPDMVYNSKTKTWREEY
jgi:hypothetical protein